MKLMEDYRTRLINKCNGEVDNRSSFHKIPEFVQKNGVKKQTNLTTPDHLFTHIYESLIQMNTHEVSKSYKK